MRQLTIHSVIKSYKIQLYIHQLYRAEKDELLIILSKLQKVVLEKALYEHLSNAKNFKNY